MRTCGLVVMVLCVVGGGLWAGEPNADQLMREFTGQAPAAERTPQQLEAAFATVLDALLPKMGSENPGERQGPEQTLQGICWRAGRPGAEAERAAVCNAIAVRIGPDTPKPARVWLLKQLERIGRGETVSATAALLTDKDAQVRECARRALQNNPAPEAADKLRSDLDRADTPEWRVAVINALGGRADTAGVKALIQQAAAGNDDVRSAAVAALARIGDKSAANVVAAAMAKGSDRAKSIATDAYLLLADRLCEKDDRPTALAMYRKLLGAAGHIKCAAIIGVGRAGTITDLPTIFDALADKDAKLRGAGLAALELMPGKDVTGAIADKAKTASPELKAVLLGVLAERGDKTALPIFIASATDPDQNVRIAALEGMGKLGDEGAMPTLLAALTRAQGREREVAEDAITRMPGDGATVALTRAVDAADPKARPDLLRVLFLRRSVGSVPTFLKYAEDPDGAVRLPSLRALGDLAGERDLPALVKLLLKAKDAGERETAEKALVAACGRVQDPEKRAEPVLAAISGADLPTRAALLRVVGRVGGKKTLDVLRAALKDANAEIKDAAVRSLADWPDASVAGDLLELAKSAPNETHQVLALRGYVRVVGLPSERPAAATLKLYEDGLNAAKRPDEKKLVLAGVAEVKDIAALRMVEPFLSDEALKSEAAAAATKIAREINNEQALPAMKKLVELSQDANVRRQAAEAAVRIVEKFPKERQQEMVDICQIAIKIGGIDRGVAARCIELLRNAGVQVKDFAQEQGCVTAWWLLGPLPNPNSELWEKALPPEKEVTLDAPVSYNKKEYKWKAYRSPDMAGVVDLGSIFGGENVGAYLYAEITVPEAKDAAFLMGSDDQIACWLNGKRVWANKTNRGITPDQDRAETHLEAGVNKILVKVLNDGDGWAACLRITDRAGKAIAFTQREK